jgi:hypothetical protein
MSEELNARIKMPGNSSSINNTPPAPPIGSNGQDKKSIKFSLVESLKENSGFEPEAAEKIATKITANLKGKKNYTEEDVFKAANSIYGFDNGKNLGLRDGIDGLNNLYNVNYTTEEKTGTSKAIWEEAIGQSSKDDSRNIVSRSIERLKKDEQEITVDNIIKDLEAKGVLTNTQNPALRKILVSANEKGISPQQIEGAVIDDDNWRKLVGRIKDPKAPETP